MAINITPSFWDYNPGAIDQLKEMWAKGISASTIARLLDPHGRLSRNAVIGKARRLGMRYAVKFAKQLNGHKAAKPKRRRRLHIKEDLLVVRKDPEFVPGQQCRDLPYEKPKTAISLFRLEPHHCRWPVGKQEELLFCGAVAVADSRLTFCLEHSKRAISGKVYNGDNRYVPFRR